MPLHRPAVRALMLRLRKAAAKILPVILLVTLVTLDMASIKALAADMWDRWQAHDETSMKHIDHSAWETLLLNYLRPGGDGVHRFAYGKVKTNDREALDGYLRALSETDIAGYRRNEQMAYWINLYNALTIDLILDHYPIASIQKLHDPTSGRRQGPWDRKLVTVDGVSLSLNDIEKRILKPIWQDQRIQYALSCGAIGCPNLQPTPYSGSDLERQLSDVAMAYINDERCITIDGDKLRVSSLYRWNIQDFGGSDQSIIHHLMAYAAPDLAMSLQKFDRIHGDGFDWRLNDINE